MGRVRNKLVKRAARQIIERYYNKLTLDFDTNKKVTEEVALIPSKALRNKIAGFVTHLMKRIQRGPVHGISLKLQEEERERRMDFIPEKSALDLDTVEIDQDTHDMLKSLDFPELAGVVLGQTSGGGGGGGGGGFVRGGPREGGNREGGPRERRNKGKDGQPSAKPQPQQSAEKK